MCLVNQTESWATKRVRADSLAGAPLRLRFHVDTDDVVQLGGMRIDDVQVRDCRRIACGNGALEAGEQCDDGNALNGDGCDANCTPSACGKGVVTPPEQCDDGSAEYLDATLVL